MVTLETAESLKAIASILVNMIPGGAIFVITDKEKITFKQGSNEFDIPAINMGTRLRKGGGPLQAIRENIKTEETVERSVYGIRLKIVSIPIIEGESAEGCLGFIFPRLHPAVKAFEVIAPMIVDMFSEGAVMYMTDREKIGRYQGSKKFNLPNVQIGNRISNYITAEEAINTKRMVTLELDEQEYGLPVQVTSYPVLDEDDDSNDVVASFNIALPRKTTMELREMALSLNSSLDEMSSAVQEMAATATTISINEQELHGSILNIATLSEEINAILISIRQLADETKMLGLNAAIEAARAGEVGRGFGVVAAEIRKLSDESKTTVTKIRALTEGIKQKVNDTLKQSEATLKSIEEQAAVSQEFSAAIEEISSMSKKLKVIAQVI